MTCDYCEGPIAAGDEDAATWRHETPAPRRPRPRFGYGYIQAPGLLVAVVMLCERCREVCTVRELARMLAQRIGEATPE